MNPKSLTLEDVDRAALALADKISAAQLSPAVAMPIETAGIYIGERLAEHFQIKCLGIQASRKGKGLKNLVAPIFHLLPEGISHFMRRLELRSNVHGARSERQVSFTGAPPASDGCILLVDDAVDTGHSMLAVVNFLLSRGYSHNNIITVAITVTGSQPVFIPDYYLYRHVITFPWSPGSRNYGAYYRYLKEMRATTRG